MATDERSRSAESVITIPESVITMAGMSDHDPGIGDHDGRNGRSGWIGISDQDGPEYAVEDTTEVRTAFEAYVAYVLLTGGGFPNLETDWQYLRSRYFQEWQGRHYWQVDHRAHSVLHQGWVYRQIIYVDEHGYIVWPFDCK